MILITIDFYILVIPTKWANKIRSLDAEQTSFPLIKSKRPNEFFACEKEKLEELINEVEVEVIDGNHRLKLWREMKLDTIKACLVCPVDENGLQMTKGEFDTLQGGLNFLQSSTAPSSMLVFLEASPQFCCANLQDEFVQNT